MISKNRIIKDGIQLGREIDKNEIIGVKNLIATNLSTLYNGKYDFKYVSSISIKKGDLLLIRDEYSSRSNLCEVIHNYINLFNEHTTIVKVKLPDIDYNANLRLIKDILNLVFRKE